MNKKAILKIVVSAVLFTIILLKADVTEVISNFRLLDPLYIPLIITFLVLNYIVSSIRWKKLLIFENSEKVTVTFLTKLYFIGAFFNNFMPTSIGGDVYKIFRLGNKIDSKSNAFSATFMERFTGMIALVLISYLGIVKTWDFWMSLLPASIKQNALLLIVFQGAVFLGFWVAAFAGFASLKFLSKKINKLAGLYDSLMVYKNERGVLAWAFITSFIVQLLAIFTQYFIFKGMGIDLPIFYSLAVFPVITLASFFVPSLNGVGVQDALYIQLFQTVGVSGSLALSASILYHIFRLLVSLVGGVFYAMDKSN